MTTQLFKAKDVRSAIGMVTDKFGDEAIILSTKQNNGVVEIEASNNNEVLTSFPRKKEENKTFSKIFYKKLDEDIPSFTKKNPHEKIKNKFNSKNIIEQPSEQTSKDLDINFIKKELLNLKKIISGMILTNESNLCDELSNSTPIKLRQEKFSPDLISMLSYSYQGKNLDEGRLSFFRELSKKLSSNDFDRILTSKNIFVFGSSGSGKSTLVAKLAAYISDKKNKSKINFINVSNTSTQHSETLRGYSRVLGFRMKELSTFNFKENSKNADEVNLFDFSGDLSFSLKKINEIKLMDKNFDFCSILALQSGSNSAMIDDVWSRVSDLKPMIAMTKLDECWTGAEELSSIALNKARIGIFTGTKVIIDSILPANENSLSKYMKENFQSV